MPKDTKEDEQKTERFNMFLSPSEMKAIEDWAWANRIRSKSEAVRILVQMGLILDNNAFGLASEFLDLTEGFGNKSLATLETISKDDPEGHSPENLQRLVVETFELAIETHERLTYLQQRLSMILQPYQALKSHNSFEDAKYHLLSAQADSLAKALQTKVDIYELKKKHDLLPKDEERNEE
ncbi:hypothetical protein GOC94_26670 [Sinorhizobium medicae]|nr:hypothetical protein [Sinorhizobium medicae]MDX0530721.1 hypothetical protein [Sinorhizobium medicae]